MTLSSLVSTIPGAICSGDGSAVIDHITINSRTVRSGSLFIAMRGETVNGADYIDSALQAGAVAIVSENAPPHDCAIPWVHVRDARYAAGVIADLFHDQPSAKMKVVGVTGTNGKTTTSFLLHHVLSSVWQRAGLIGTLVTHDGLKQEVATHTTPLALDAHAALHRMADNGCKAAAMEVSSHGIDQQRIAGIDFDCAIFTNLTQDHLDYHGTMQAYFEVKKRLFTDLQAKPGKRRPSAIINIDDLYGEKLVSDLREGLFVQTYGYSVQADFRAVNVQGSASGTTFELLHKEKRYLVKVPLVGRFNVLNSLAVIAAAASLGIRPRDSVRALADSPQVPGRVEFVDNIGGASVIVDYAHTPDALTNVCRTLRELEPNRIFTLFGCGGDRDASKRPKMAQAASALSDFVILTSDNPRTEDPEKILADAAKGLGDCPSEIIVDRREAIERAVNSLRKGDVLLIAGKGHETYQEINGVRHPFDDRKVAERFMQDRTMSTVKEARIKDKEYAKKRAMQERQQGDRHWEKDGGNPSRFKKSSYDESPRFESEMKEDEPSVWNREPHDKPLQGRDAE